MRTSRVLMIASAFDATYRDKDNKYPGGTQTAYAIPLDFGLVPADRKNAVVDHLVADIVKGGYHPGSCGTATRPGQA